MLELGDIFDKEEPLSPSESESNDTVTSPPSCRVSSKMEFFRTPEEMDLSAPNLAKTWELWSKKFKNFIVAMGLKEEDDERKLAILLHCIGDAGVKIHSTFPAESKDSYERVLKAFNDHFEPKKNIVFQRYKFLTSRQKSAETIEQFLSSLKELSLSCEYPDTDSMVRDVFIIGLQDDKLRRVLLDCENLKLSEAEVKAKSFILSKTQAKEMSSSSNEIAVGRQINVVNKSSVPKKIKVNRQQHQKCQRCGAIEHRNKCPAIGVKCYKCNGVGIAIFSYVYGGHLGVVNRYDSFGNMCGVDRNEKFLAFPLSGLNMTERKFLFHFSSNNKNEALKICVDRCPDVNISTPLQLHKYHIDLNTNLCRYDYNISLLADMKVNETNYFHRLGPCPSLNIVKTEPLLQICLPKSKDVYWFDKWEYHSLAQFILTNLYNKGHYLLAVVLVATGLSFGTAILIHMFPKNVPSLVCCLYFIAGTTFSATTLFLYFNEQSDVQSDIFLIQNVVFLALSIFTGFSVFILMITFYSSWANMESATKLFKESGQCLSSVPSLMLLPLVAFFMLLLLSTFEFYVIMQLTSSSYPTIRPFSLQNISDNHSGVTLNGNISTDSYKTFSQIEQTEAHWLRSMIWIHIVGFIWTLEFISACLQFTLAGSVAHWYFNKSATNHVKYMLAKLIKYHLGSVIKGAFLISTFKPFRIFFASLYMRLKDGERHGWHPASYGGNICGCCFWLMENFIRYLNHTAYVVIAIESIPFSAAAKIAWNTTYFLESSSRQKRFSETATLILFAAKLLITIISAIVGLAIFYRRLDELFFSSLLILCILLTYRVTHLLLTMYEIMIDTLSLCASERMVLNIYTSHWGQACTGQFPDSLNSKTESLKPLFEMTPVTQQ